MKNYNIFKILLLFVFVFCVKAAFGQESCSAPNIMPEMEQYRPDPDSKCKTQTRTCCNNSVWSDWGMQCPDFCPEGFGPYMLWDPEHPRPEYNFCENNPGIGCYEFVRCGGPDTPCPKLRSAVHVENIQAGFRCGQGYNPPACQNKYSPKCSDSVVSSFCRQHNGTSGTKCPYDLGYEEGPLADEWCRTSAQSQCLFYGNAASYAGEQACSISYAFRADNTAYCSYAYTLLSGFRCLDTGEEDTSFEYYHVCGENY